VLVICILCIYLALLAQFKNAVKPLIVFAAIPYGIVGAVTALAIMGEPFGFMAFLGVISLIGIIVSHIIVLFEFIEERREAGEELELALIDAGILRLRPVLITVAATVFALIPLAIHGGPLWQGLCYAQIGGLTIATFITLGLVPILYSFVVLDLKWVAWGEKKEGRGENGGKDSGGASDPNTQTQSQQRPQQQRPSESHA
jgi:multidrug efflux pump subunit AcrB